MTAYSHPCPAPRCATVVAAARTLCRFHERTMRHPGADALAASLGRPVCGVRLRVLGEPCARRPVHGGPCRSLYAVDNARRMRVGLDAPRRRAAA